MSSGHYIESLLVGGGVGYGGAGWTLGIGGAISAMARPGYSNDAFFGGQTFKKGSASLTEGEVTGSFRVHTNVWLETGVAAEMARVSIADVAEYDGFGLTVAEGGAPSRDYALTTVVARIGVRKEF